MKIHEYQGKEVLRQYGVPVPRGYPAFSVREASEAAQKLGGSVWVVKAQIHAGGRGKGTIKDNPAQRGVQLVKSADEAAKAYAAAVSLIDKAARRKYVSKNMAARNKSRLALLVNKKKAAK